MDKMAQMAEEAATNLFVLLKGDPRYIKFVARDTGYETERSLMFNSPSQGWQEVGEASYDSSGDLIDSWYLADEFNEEIEAAFNELSEKQ